MDKTKDAVFVEMGETKDGEKATFVSALMMRDVFCQSVYQLIECREIIWMESDGFLAYEKDDFHYDLYFKIVVKKAPIIHDCDYIYCHAGGKKEEVREMKKLINKNVFFNEDFILQEDFRLTTIDLVKKCLLFH